MFMHTHIFTKTGFLTLSSLVLLQIHYINIESNTDYMSKVA